MIHDVCHLKKSKNIRIERAAAKALRSIHGICTDRVAGHAEMVFGSHFGGVFDLCGAATEQLVGSSGCHGAGNTDFTLTADFGP